MTNKTFLKTTTILCGFVAFLSLETFATEINNNGNGSRTATRTQVDTGRTYSTTIDKDVNQETGTVGTTITNNNTGSTTTATTTRTKNEDGSMTKTMTRESLGPRTADITRSKTSRTPQ